jgi:3-isopropylmalate dehydratase small subunit
MCVSRKHAQSALKNHSIKAVIKSRYKRQHHCFDGARYMYLYGRKGSKSRACLRY